MRACLPHPSGSQPCPGSPGWPAGWGSAAAERASQEQRSICRAHDAGNEIERSGELRPIHSLTHGAETYEGGTVVFVFFSSAHYGNLNGTTTSFPQISHHP